MDSNTIEEKIKQARTLRAQAHGDYPVSFQSIAEMLTRQSAENPDQDFLVYYGDDGPRRAYKYQEFANKVRNLASALSKQYSIQRGDRVATVMFNHPLTVFTYFAVWSLGGVVVPINVEETEERTRFIIENAGAKLCIAMKEVAPKANNCVGQIPLLKSEDPQEFSVEAGLSKESEAPSATSHLDDDALIVYTSGTTGMPKGVLLSQYNLLADARAIAEMHGIVASTRMMCVLPIHHVNGTVVTLMTPLYAGGTVVLNRRFSAGTFWRNAAQEQVEVCSVVPTLLHFLYERNEDISRYKLEKFRHFICGAGPLTVELAAHFEDRFGFRIVHGYGLSETTCYSCFIPPSISADEHKSWMRDHGFPSIGIPIPPNQMAIHDPAGNAVPEGLRGEIVIRGHNVMKGYYNNPQANQDAFTYGWFRSGDEGFCIIDAAGNPYFFITGRIKELIARGGVKFAPLEIDEVLNSIPGVRHGVAVGFENDAYGEEVAAYVELEANTKLSEAQIIEACRKKLSFAKCPKVVKFGTDIPYTSTGKIQRGKLKPLFTQFKTQQFRET